MIDQYIYCTYTYIDIWQQPDILKFLNVEMNSAPEHTADEDGEHPKKSRFVRVSVFTLFKQLICNLGLFDRLDQVLVMKDNDFILSIQISHIDLIIRDWCDPQLFYTITAERE